MFFIKNLLNSKKISNEQFTEILDKMQWYFSFLEDFKFGNETKDIQEINNIIINKDYVQLISKRNFKDKSKDD